MTTRLVFLLIAQLTLRAAGAVVTEHNDIGRTGATSGETVLNASSVNVNTFGKLFSTPVDGRIFGQPLYVPDVIIPGEGLHNVIYVGTAHNSVYAYDADATEASSPLWQTNLGPAVPSAALNIVDDFGPEIGITSTPVIDLQTRTIYAVAETYENGTVIFRLHALDISSVKLGGPGSDPRNRAWEYGRWQRSYSKALIPLIKYKERACYC